MSECYALLQVTGPQLEMLAAVIQEAAPDIIGEFVKISFYDDDVIFTYDTKRKLSTYLSYKELCDRNQKREEHEKNQIHHCDACGKTYATPNEAMARLNWCETCDVEYCDSCTEASDHWKNDSWQCPAEENEND